MELILRLSKIGFYMVGIIPEFRSFFKVLGIYHELWDWNDGWERVGISGLFSIPATVQR